MKHNSVFAAVRDAAFKHKLLSVGTALCAAASVLASLLPPLVLARIIDNLTGGMPLAFSAALLYFGSLALEGVLASAQETLPADDAHAPFRNVPEADEAFCRDAFGAEPRRDCRAVLRRCGHG